MIDWGNYTLASCMLKKKSCTRLWLVPFAFVAMGAFALAISGCRKEEEPASPSPEVYMNDPVFRRELADGRKERESFLVKRTELVRKLERMVEAKKAALPGADDAAVKAALEKDPEWNDLVQRVKDLSTAMKEGGRRMDEVIRRRIAPKKEISK